MNKVKAPMSLRLPPTGGERAALSLVAALASSVSASALAQTTLPAVNVDAPREKPHLVAPVKPKPVAVAAAKPRAATRHAASAPAAGARRSASSAPSTTAQGGGGGGVPAIVTAANANPYADPVAPYKVDRLSSNKFTQPVLNTPRTIQTLTKEVLEDKNATSLREIGRSTAGVTLGVGEGGNAFGDRFFIRGFDARNDVFVDGVRDPGVSIRENFYTEQVEILRGPGSTFAGRGTAGGAINIVTKQASDRDFADLKVLGGFSDHTKRVTLDVNKTLSPILAVRVNGMFQDANVAGRNFVTDNRDGVSGSVVFRPVEGLTLTAGYTHVYQSGLPDFGVPYNRLAKGYLFNRPFTERFTPRYTWYGFVDRDFQMSSQDFGALTAQYRVNDNLTLNSRLRQGRSVLDYVGTLAQGANLFAGTVRLSPQSRYQVTNVLANQSDATIKFATGPIRHDVVAGVEFSREGVTRDTYGGLQSELNTTGPVSGAVTGNLFLPPNYLPFPNDPYRRGNPTRIAVDTKSGYLIETANWQDLVLVNGGVRFDDYKITSRNEIYRPYAESHSAMWNYNAGLVLKPAPNVSLYAAYATSTNPVGSELDGGAANYGGLTTAAQIFPPQYNRSREIGAKWETFGGHLLATAALFRTDVSGAREVFGRTTDGNAAYYVQGVDLQLAGNITPRWSVIGGFVAMKSEVTRSFAPTNVGLMLANVAHESFSVLSKVKFGDLVGMEMDGLEVGGQAVWRSKIYGGSNLVANGGPRFDAQGLPAPNAANPLLNAPTELPSYWRFDIFAEANLSKNVTLKASINNLFNRTYYDAFYQTAAPFAQMAPGRGAYLEARVKF